MMDLGPSNPLGLVVLATCLSFALGEELIGCFEEAECIGATSTGIAQALNANECYDLCHNLPNCNFFTFYTDDSFCFTYSNCPKINSDCDNCISGERDCSQICGLPGVCMDVAIAVKAVSKANTCIQFCHDFEGCQFWNYHELDGTCSLFADCSSVDTSTCPTCIYGDNTCQLSIETLFVYGGYKSGGSLSSVEAHSLSGSIVQCPQVQDLPQSVYAFPGLSIDGKPVMCGGLWDGHSQKDCWLYNPENGNWEQMSSMSQARHYYPGLQLTRSSFWVTGGYSVNMSISSTEIYESGFFKAGPTLPTEMTEHCMVKLNGSHVLISGGPSKDSRTTYNQFYMYDFIEDSWTELAPMQESRYGHGCGLVTLEDGTQELVVAGGHTTSVEIYSFENQNWRFGNTQLQHEIFYPASVPFRNTFLIVGGRCDTQCDPHIYHSEILEYIPDRETWRIRPETLDQERSHFAALLIEDSILNCI